MEETYAREAISLRTVESKRHSMGASARDRWRVKNNPLYCIIGAIQRLREAPGSGFSHLGWH